MLGISPLPLPKSPTSLLGSLPRHSAKRNPVHSCVLFRPRAVIVVDITLLPLLRHSVRALHTGEEESCDLTHLFHTGNQTFEAVQTPPRSPSGCSSHHHAFLPRPFALPTPTRPLGGRSNTSKTRYMTRRVSRPKYPIARVPVRRPNYRRSIHGRQFLVKNPKIVCPSLPTISKIRLRRESGTRSTH